MIENPHNDLMKLQEQAVQNHPGCCFPTVDLYFARSYVEARPCRHHSKSPASETGIADNTQHL